MTETDENDLFGSAYVTPQQKRRRVTNALPGHHPHNLRSRKVSAPPELQAHLGKKAVPTFNFSSSWLQSSSIPELNDSSSVKELIINLGSATKLALPETERIGGSDSGIPSEYSSWTCPGVTHCENSSPYEDVSPRSISVSLEDIPSAGGRNLSSDSETEVEETMVSPERNRESGDGVVNPAYVDTEASKRGMALALKGPSALPPHVLTRAQTDTNLLSSPTHSLPGRISTRPRTNSMVFQLNFAQGIPGVANAFPSARSVSMVSLNTAGHTNSAPLNYPNLARFAHDAQSIYSDAGTPATFTPRYLAIENTMDSQASLSCYGPSGKQHPAESEEEEAQPTDPEVKKKWFISTLFQNLGTMYAILLFMIGCVLYMADTFSLSDLGLGEVFNIYLIVVQLLWLGYIHVDVRKYVNTISQALEEANEADAKGEPVQLESTPDGQYQLRINLPEPKKTFPQYYGFTSGRHGGSLYLKIGAAVFCLGYLIHAGLNLGQKIIYVIDENPGFEKCTSAQDILMSVLRPVYAFYQLFFIFKYSNLIINRRKRLSRFAMMHCISASLLFWVYTIMQETLQAISSKKAKYAALHNITTTPRPTTDSEEDDDDHSTSPSHVSKHFFVNYGCGVTTPLTKMINDTTPYLYPFSIEYNILIVGIWILLWENIGRMERHTHLPSIEMTYEDDNTKGIASNLIIYVDCHSSNRGLFAGLLMTVAAVISIILFFIFTANDSTKVHGLQLNGFSELFVLLIVTVMAVLAHLKLRQLDIMTHEVSSVDDILLYICLPCIFLYSVFSMVPAITSSKPLFVAVSMAQIFQPIVQTALICDGLRRCSNSSNLTSRKPGRELITFLVVANVALWLLATFEIKSEDGNYFKYEYYGKDAWTLLSHLTLPLALFYRFHSSVCLVDIWKAGYEAETEH